MWDGKTAVCVVGLGIVTKYDFKLANTTEHFLFAHGCQKTRNYFEGIEDDHFSCANIKYK